MTPKAYFENAKRVASEATPGPWHSTGSGWPSVIQTSHVTRDVWTISELGNHYGMNSGKHVYEDAAFIASSRTQVPVLAEAALVMLSALENASTATEDKFESCAHGWHSDWYNDTLRDADDYVCPTCKSSGFGGRIRTAVPTEKAKAASETLARVAELVGAG